MITAGVDIGSTTAKTVILQDRAILAAAVIPARLDPVASAREVMDLGLQKAGVRQADLQRIVGTGYGQQQIPFAARLESEITCHARGAFFHHPAARTLIDIGGQDAKVIKMDARGKVVQYSYNDKCASGTGRFLEIMAEALGVGLEQMGAAGRTCVERLSISNQCVIFAETEVVSLINEEKAVGDILNALFRAMAHRVASQVRSLTVEADVLLTGGVAKNIGLFEALGQSLGVTLQTPSELDPQLNGALGAALLGQEG
ncbi:MAG: 2-hydroxyglutaryl-CoA dehydratase [Desulfobacterales bacterium]|nr:2-hydroxyglutaryl-CoA dehydratase [Desulfobacterales bacterium]